MNISLRWLKDYIDLPFEVEEISEMLTLIGLEVEGLEEQENLKGGLRGVVVGHVLSCEPHPDADRLKLTTVDVGSENPLQIVCGAPNVDQGQKVLVATIGTTLYSKEGEPWKIKKGKIRGQVSEGMICAEDELGLGNSHDGIMVLDEASEVGTPAASLFDVYTDHIFDIGLTPNRSDATSHLGVARDLYAYILFHFPEKAKLKLPTTETFKVENQTDIFKVEIANKEACPRYSGITISDIKVGASPKWIVDKLAAIGVNSINNVVDITNFVLHETGQPLHAFDADKIPSKKIIVTTLSEGTLFTTLDGVERKLLETDLMICNGEKEPLCMAGVYGGMDSGVTEETTTIFLESAYFSASSIRKTSTAHNLRTDAAKVYEKGADPNVVTYALKRAANLLKEYAQGVITSEIEDEYPETINQKEIRLRYQKVNDVIGAKLSKDDIHNILNGMGMEINPLDEDSIRVKVPTNKADVIREVDVIEEILRIYGFNKIEIPSKVVSTLSYTSQPEKSAVKDRMAAILTSSGYLEMMNLSLIESKYYEASKLASSENLVRINNTSNVHLDVMRPEMLTPALLTIKHNLNRQQHHLKMFEFGKEYAKGNASFVETEQLILINAGEKPAEHWTGTQGNSDFYTLKLDVHRILQSLNIQKFQISESEHLGLEYGLHYHRGDQSLVHFGTVDGALIEELDIKETIQYAVFDLSNLLKAIKTNFEVSGVSKYPSVRRDLALVIDNAVSFDSIEQIAKKTDKKLLKEVKLFDIYKDEEKLGKDKKSYAVSFSFVDIEKTLKDKEIDKLMNKMISSFERDLGALIRK